MNPAIVSVHEPGTGLGPAASAGPASGNDGSRRAIA